MILNRFKTYKFERSLEHLIRNRSTAWRTLVAILGFGMVPISSLKVSSLTRESQIHSLRPSLECELKFAAHSNAY